MAKNDRSDKSDKSKGPKVTKWDGTIGAHSSTREPSSSGPVGEADSPIFDPDETPGGKHQK